MVCGVGVELTGLWNVDGRQGQGHSWPLLWFTSDSLMGSVTITGFVTCVTVCKLTLVDVETCLTLERERLRPAF